jgi:hypothetical protein
VLKYLSRTEASTVPSLSFILDSAAIDFARVFEGAAAELSKRFIVNTFNANSFHKFASKDLDQTSALLWTQKLFSNYESQFHKWDTHP